MTTDNRTNEELAERLRQLAESQAMDFDSPHVAMTLNEAAGRLATQKQNGILPNFACTDEQIEAAERVVGGRCVTCGGEAFEGDADGVGEYLAAPAVQQVSESDLAKGPALDVEKVVDALVMTDLSDYAGTDMGMIRAAARAVVAALEGGKREHD